MTDENLQVLVTGATGFLGHRLCQRLQDQAIRVVALGRRSAEGPWERFIEHDLTAEAPPAEVLDGIDTIYHLASRAHALSDTPAQAAAYHEVIVEGTRRLLDSAKSAGVQRFIYTSSVKAMGEGNPPAKQLAPLDETCPMDPAGPYGAAKAEAERLVLDSGLPHVTVLRPVMVYGPGEKGNLPRMVNAIRRGRFPPLPETGNRRSMIHVDDVVEFSLRAGRLSIAAGKTYILSGPDALSTRELYNAIRESLGLPPKKGAVPLALLRTAALAGSVLGKLSGRRMPLDLDSLSKLIQSAWYASGLAEEELGYRARHSVRQWLREGGPIA